MCRSRFPEDCGRRCRHPRGCSVGRSFIRLRQTFQRPSSRPLSLLLDGSRPQVLPTSSFLSPRRGSTWTAPHSVTDQFTQPVDRFNQWLAVDSVTGDVNLSFYDTRNDTNGFRFMTDTYFTQSVDGGVTFLTPNVRVSSVSSNEHD